MAIKGTAQKGVVMNAILELFPGSFVEEAGKTLRIPVKDGDKYLEIKVALTCAKTPLRDAPKSDDFLVEEVKIKLPTAEEIEELVAYLNGNEDEDNE